MEYQLSVVVTVYNTEPYLRKCLESIINQTFQPIEMIIVNDGSTDGSTEIIEEFAKNHNHIKVIHQENKGVASACNAGIKAATGKYVTIADSDDFVPPNAYEKLLAKAEETEADLVVGKGNLLIDGEQREFLAKKEKYVWQKERVISSIYEYLDLFYDVFYWNKMFRREFLLEHQCFLPEGMIYSDRPMVHKTFIYAKKIAIIPEVVYLWRKRSKKAAPSLSQDKSSLHNFEDRIRSYRYQLDYFEQFGDKKLTNEFLIRNLYRLLLPIKGILEDESFKDIYIKEVRDLFNLIDDIYNNELSIVENLYIYMIQNDLIPELLQILTEKPTGEVIEENGKYYWATEYFRHSELKIPDGIFEIKTLEPQFIKIESMTTRNQRFQFNGITVPNMFPIQKVTLEFQARGISEDKHTFELIKGEGNHFSGDISLDHLNKEESYDVYLMFGQEDKEDKFRITREMVRIYEDDYQKNKTKYFQLRFTKKDNLSITGISIEVNRIDITKDGLRIQLEKHNHPSLELILCGRNSKKPCPIAKNEGNNWYEINWDFITKSDKLYDIFYLILGKKYRIRLDQMKAFEPFLVEQEDRYIASYITKKGNISIGVSPHLSVTNLALTTDKIELTTNHNASTLLEFFIVDRSNNRKFIFDAEKGNLFHCKLRHLMKKNTVFDVYYKIFNSEFRLSLDKIEGFESKVIKKDHSFIDMYKTIKNNLSFHAGYLTPVDTPKITRQKLMVSTGNTEPESLKFFIKDTQTGDSYYFQKNGLKRHELSWDKFQLRETTYDWYFEVFSHPFKLDDLFIDDFIPSFRTEPAFVFLHETKKGEISVKAALDFTIEKLKIDEDGISLKLNKGANDSMAFFLKDRTTRDTYVFDKISPDEFVMKWEPFLKENKEYDFYFEIFNKEVRLNATKIKEQTLPSIKIKDIYIETGQTFKNDLYIKSLTLWSKLTSRFK